MIFDLIQPIVSKVFDRIWPDPKDQANAQLELLKLQQSGELEYLKADLQTRLAQLQINNTEAASESLFKSGWRPLIGWTCGASFAWQFVAGPALTWLSNLVGHPMLLPSTDLSQMMPVLLGMLGMGLMRTYEKTQAK